MKDYDNKPRASDAIGTQVEAQDAEPSPKIEVQDEAQDRVQSEPEAPREIETQDGAQSEQETQREPETQDVEQSEAEEQPIEQDDDPASDVVMDEAASDEQELTLRRPFSWPSRAQILGWLPFLLVIGLGAALRFWNLGDKPLHHDESLHAYFSLMLLHFNIEQWGGCLNGTLSPYCYKYDPLLHGPFQFHAIAFVYLISQLLHVADNGVNTTTVRIAAATLGTVIVGLPYLVRDRLGNLGAWLACFLLAVSPSMVYFSRFAREDIYMACWTLLLVVAVARYLSTRKASWLIWAAAAFALSYATKEATFLSIAVFGSFMGGLIAWELGRRWRLPRDQQQEAEGDAVDRRDAIDVDNRRGAIRALILYVLVMIPLALILFGVLKELSIYTNPPYTKISDQVVAQIKNVTLVVVPLLGIVLGALVVYKLWGEMREGEDIVMTPERRGLARRIDPQRQPLLDTIFSTPWTYWFFAVVVAWAIFLVLFTALFTNIRGGIADGIWQGLYYWIQQQGQDRGAQPWYYYFMLIPLYEQIGVVFGIVGVVRALLRPTRFRLFLVYWCVGNFFIYTWAAEKMPWLMIHIMMPMLLLAALGLEPVVRRLAVWGGAMLRRREEIPASAQPVIRAGRHIPVGALASLVVAICLLVLTLQNMFQVNYVHAADGPHEMMIYVQTTTDVNIVMSKINTLDQRMDGGRHTLAIGVTNDGTWPMIWYLRDYTNVCYNFPGGCTNNGKDVQVIITGGDSLGTIASQYASASPGKMPAFAFHEYHMRTWWDEGYKPSACTPNASDNYCSGAPAYVGPWLWLSYGDNPPPGAKFNPVLAAQHIWEWWWQRRPFGATDGSYDMGLLIRSNLGVSP